jgi:hypothetical protein
MNTFDLVLKEDVLVIVGGFQYRTLEPVKVVTLGTQPIEMVLIDGVYTAKVVSDL